MLDLLKDVWVPAPVMVMGVSATMAGACAFASPETAGEKLPDTIEEAEYIGEKQKMNRNVHK